MTWTSRLAPAAIVPIVQEALAAGHLDDGAVMFHDLPTLRGNLAALVGAFPAGATHAIAIKANPLVALLEVLVADGAGLEAASLEEVHVALAAGCPPERIVYDSPAKTVPELREAMARGIRINADNPDELRRISALREQGLSHGPVGLRVNPVVGEGAIAITAVAGAGSRFGVRLDDAPDVLAAFPFVTGLHVHVGSQGCPLPLLVEGTVRVARLADRPGITWLDVGGGLPAWYDGTLPEPPGPAEWARALSQAMPEILSGRWHLVTELGRSMLAGSGFTVSPVEVVKAVAGDQVVVIHVGADLLLRAAYLPAQWRHETILLDPRGEPRQGAVSSIVAGPLCFAGDVIARAPLPPARPGDLLVLRDTGAYTLGMWSRHCSRGMPLVLGHDRGTFAVLRRRETPADVARFWS